MANYVNHRRRWGKMDEDDQRDEIARVVTHYRNMKLMAVSMYNEVVSQYKDMAAGGDGGDLGFNPTRSSEGIETLVENLMPVSTQYSVRAYNYPGYPDYFFARVLANLGEEYKHYAV